MSELDKTIGKNLQFLRRHFGYNQEQISEMLGISQPAYSKYESGENTVSRTALERLAALYNVEEYDLMQEDTALLAPALTLAFRGKADLQAVEQFHRIVKNYIQMTDELRKTE